MERSRYSKTRSKIAWEPVLNTRRRRIFSFFLKFLNDSCETACENDLRERLLGTIFFEFLKLVIIFFFRFVCVWGPYDRRLSVFPRGIDASLHVPQLPCTGTCSSSPRWRISFRARRQCQQCYLSVLSVCYQCAISVLSQCAISASSFFRVSREFIRNP